MNTMKPVQNTGSHIKQTMIATAKRDYEAPRVEVLRFHDVVQGGSSGIGERGGRKPQVR